MSCCQKIRQHLHYRVDSSIRNRPTYTLVFRLEEDTSHIKGENLCAKKERGLHVLLSGFLDMTEENDEEVIAWVLILLRLEFGT